MGLPYGTPIFRNRMVESSSNELDDAGRSSELKKYKFCSGRLEIAEKAIPLHPVFRKPSLKSIKERCSSG